MNHFIGIGRLTGGAELKYIANGTPCCKFSICINKTWKDKNGEKQEKPSFFNCVLWGKYGELMSKYLTKGKQIAIEGELEQNAWEDNNHVKHNSIQINVNELFLLQSPKGENGGADIPQGKATEPGKDDIPF
jgi:single-strand DNA-binding protein